MTRPRIYLAGPDVFRRDALARGEELKRMCEAYDVEGLYPLDCCPLQDSDDIRKQCIAMLNNADAVVADISPFRGKHMDPGTAWEIGYAEALGKPVFLWSTDTRPMVQRIAGALDVDHGVKVRDAQGMLIEDHGKPENLMISSSRSFVYARPEQAIDQAAGILEAQAATRATIKAGYRRIGAVGLGILALLLATMAAIVIARADIYVIDGDTIVVDREHIRIIGLDAPETRNAQCDDELRRGLEAKARLIDELSAYCGPLARAPASCLTIDRQPRHDRYNRSLATVSVQGRDVAATLIAAGMARAYVCDAHCPKRRSWCGGEMEALLTPREAAEHLRISVKTLLAHVEAGAIRYVQVGRGLKKPRRMFSNDDIEEFVERQRRKDVPCRSTGLKTLRTSTTTSRSEVVAFTAVPRPAPVKRQRW